jgi:diguanylate cyclase (GGDEF)-like protein
MKQRFAIKPVLAQGLLGLGAALAAVAIVLGWEHTLFDFLGDPDHGHPLEFHDITLALATMVSTGLLGGVARLLVQQRREVQRRIQAEKHARNLAHQDALTGLPNRRQFHKALNAAVAAPPRAGSAHAVFILDLNGFKAVNDAYGHAAGDELLVNVSHCIGEGVRDVDIVARIGGDEFAVLATHVAGPDDAANIALRIIKALDAPIHAGNASHQIGVAVGVALFPQDGASAEEILRRADIAMYRAKTEPQSALRFFEEEMDAVVRERDMLQRELKQAVKTEAIVPFYQPVMDLRSNQIIGFEALARWSHPVLGEIPPTRFIAIAEDCGLIAPLTDQLLARACADAMSWPAHLTLSFNLSPLQLKDRTLGLRVLSILAKAGLSPSRLELELTESALVRDLSAAQEVLASLRAAGVRLALDDFGTGYSSLYHLRNFKVDKIKIDRSFVAEMQTEPESAALVRALLGLGHGLGLTVTAEGIEQGQQSTELLSAGCDFGQGFLFGRAVPAAEALALLRQQQPAAIAMAAAG